MTSDNLIPAKAVRLYSLKTGKSGIYFVDTTAGHHLQCYVVTFLLRTVSVGCYKYSEILINKRSVKILITDMKVLLHAVYALEFS